MAIMNVIQKVSDTVWELPVSYKQGMRVPARIYGTEKIIREMDDAVLRAGHQCRHPARHHRYAFCMPDGHFGYGFPIGGVAAMDPEAGGVISPGGIGFDINCGMRLVTTNLTFKEVKPAPEAAGGQAFRTGSGGVGSTGFLRISKDEFREVVEQGARWCVKNGYGWEEDLELTEECGCIARRRLLEDQREGRGPRVQPDRHSRFRQSLPGNPGGEARRTSLIEKLAERLESRFPDQVVIMFHCGSRGFGHQVATDYLQLFLKVMENRYDIKILDRELACAPFRFARRPGLFRRP